ncbi:hypothetical protein H4R18_001577 [Coemansia javaensis]|uniref:Copper acquisition factor BIM1-like domain-containing protein n=1 Tax=Coemansia javaensis TaxID=2761396 RepID=A0A9W8LL66_9FUNG|nr:hypothetical protein H4R18_001577 [Coemansia javaensis]
MLKSIATTVAAVALFQGALAHMGVISPPPRNGVVADELQRPCGGGNTPTKNVTTFAVDGDSEFVLRPGHGTGNILFNYFTDTTVTNDTKSYPLANVPVPKPGNYTTKLDFGKAGLKAGQSIVVQAIFNGTDEGKTEQYYVCFDVKLAADSSGSSDSESSNTKTSDTNTSDTHSGASPKVVFGAAIGLLAAAAAAAF